ncbi:MAG TPA: DUF1858 domain-containing protein [Kofleriaceae bacterium]
MEITKDTKVADILTRYGDIANVMEALGVKRIGRFSLRKLIAKLITVEQAARIHRIPLDELLTKLRLAVTIHEAGAATEPTP